MIYLSINKKVFAIKHAFANDCNEIIILRKTDQFNCDELFAFHIYQVVNCDSNRNGIYNWRNYCVRPNVACYHHETCLIIRWGLQKQTRRDIYVKDTTTERGYQQRNNLQDRQNYKFKSSFCVSVAITKASNSKSIHLLRKSRIDNHKSLSNFRMQFR